jgi:hypothetical protein
MLFYGSNYKKAMSTSAFIIAAQKSHSDFLDDSRQKLYKRKLLFFFITVNAFMVTPLVLMNTFIRRRGRRGSEATSWPPNG